AATGADRMFDQLDTNHDGRLTEADRAHMQHGADVLIGRPDGAPAPDDENCTRTAEGNRVTIICNGGDEADSGQRVERRVIVRHGDDHTAPHAEAGRHVEREVTVVTRDGDDDDDMATPEPPAAPGAPHAPLPPRA